MAHVTIREAAASLGVSEPTIRRRMRNGDFEHGKDEQGRAWVEIFPGAEPPAAERNAPDSVTRQLIDELSAERDRWVAEAAAKQDIIDILVQQAENYQVLLYEAQAQVKRLSAPPERPPLLMERVDRPGDGLDEQEPPAESGPLIEPFDASPHRPPPDREDAELAPDPSSATPSRRSWWRW